MRYIASMFEDTSGGVSSMRVLLAMWVLAVIMVWLTVSVATLAISDIPTGVVAITGMFLGSKVFQRFAEKPENIQDVTVSGQPPTVYTFTSTTQL